MKLYNLLLKGLALEVTLGSDHRSQIGSVCFISSSVSVVVIEDGAFAAALTTPSTKSHLLLLLLLLLLLSWYDSHFSSVFFAKSNMTLVSRSPYTRIAHQYRVGKKGAATWKVAPTDDAVVTVIAVVVFAASTTDVQGIATLAFEVLAVAVIIIGER